MSDPIATRLEERRHSCSGSSRWRRWASTTLAPLFAVEAIYDEIEHLLDLQRTRLLMEIKAKARNPPP